MVTYRDPLGVRASLSTRKGEVQYYSLPGLSKKGYGDLSRMPVTVKILLESVLRHLARIVDTVGEDHASLGSDWDGAINPPRDIPTPLELPRLVEGMLRRGWKPERISKILGGNFLRTVAALRG